MKVALLGATGTIGSAYLHRALTDGHEVRVLVRDGASLNVSAVGPRTNTADAVALLASTATNVIAAMRAHAVARVVLVAGAGLVHGPPTGRARLAYDRPRGFRVSSGDVAVSIVAAVADPSTIRRASYVSVSDR